MKLICWSLPLLLASVTGCTNSAPGPSARPEGRLSPAAICGKDTDCKGDRVCEKGACVAPVSQQPAPSMESLSAWEVETSSAVPTCKEGDGRVPIPVWTPESDGKGNWSPAPPQKDGQIVYIRLATEGGDVGCGEDDLASFSIPTDPDDAMKGGLAVNLRGNVQLANGLCHFTGYYLNEEVMGVHQGWIETYFGAVPKKDVVMANRYCLEQALR